MEKCFPLNDTDYLADDLRLFHAGRSVGVMNVTGNDFLTTSGTGMQVIVGKGVAYLLTKSDGMGGIVYANTDNVTFPIDAADALLSRYDAIVIRYDSEENECALKIVKGTPASQPTKYQPERTATAYELVIKYVYVKNGIGSITNDLIEDAILNEDVCGIAVDTLANVPTQQYDNQITTWISGQQASFTSWFNSIKDQLSEDQAGNLQLQIDDIEEDVSDRIIIKKDGVPLDELNMSTTRDTSASTEKLRVQLKGSDGKIYYIEVDPDSIYLSNGKKLVTGIGFYLDDDNESITMGNYDEWVSAGSPAFPQ